MKLSGKSKAAFDNGFKDATDGKPRNNFYQYFTKGCKGPALSGFYDAGYDKGKLTTKIS